MNIERDELMDLDAELATLNGNGSFTDQSMAKVALDAALASINGRSLVPSSEVTDWLLDIRQALGAS